jgi:hypothetical protein
VCGMAAPGVSCRFPQFIVFAEGASCGSTGRRGA